MNTNLLNQLSFDLVKDKVMEDKMKEYTQDQERIQRENDLSIQERDQENLPKDDDLEKYDSEEEKIMKKEMERRKQNFEMTRIEKEKQKIITGQIKDIVETEFLDTMLKNKKVICHFYHKDFERCKIMEKHLEIIALTHGETVFVRIDAEKTPFFTTKLNIKVLPTVVLFNDGKAYDRIIGFDELGLKDDFPTINLTRRLVKAKIINAKNKSESGEVSITKRYGKNMNDDDDLDY